MLTWSGGFLTDIVLKEIKADLIKQEQTVPYMYLDTVSTVTIGNGHALPKLSDVHSINLIHKATLALASIAEKEAAWKAVQAVSSPQGTKANLAAKRFENFNDLVVTNAEVDRLFNADLTGFYKDLVGIYPGFDSLPAPAKVSLFDMIYNVGPSTLEYKFPHFTRAIRARDWKTAAAECMRPQLNGDRNARTKARFLDCASSRDPSSPPVNTPLPPSKSPAKAPEPSFTPPPFHKPIPDPQRVVTTPLLKQGDRGVDARTVQNALNRVLIGKNPLLKTDGIFGLHVAQAVKRVQQHANLLCDGTVGMQTRRALDLILVQEVARRH